MIIENVIEELMSIIIEQEKEINKLTKKLDGISNYINQYEKLIKGE